MKNWNWETIFYTHYRSIFNHCDIIGLQSYRIPWKKRKIGLLRRSRAFKVIEVGTNQKPVCDFLLVITSNRHPILYCFRVIAAYCSNFGHCIFSSPLGRGLGTAYNVYLRLTGKGVVDFLLMLIKLFLLGVTAEALRAKTDLENQQFRSNAISLTQNFR